MTPVQFHFVLPDGSPFANAPIEVQLAAATYNDNTDTGVAVPRLLTAVTDSNGKATLNLFPSTTLYYVSVMDPASDAGLSYKFLVPEVSPGTTLQLQDLVVDAPMSGTFYDDAALLAIQNSKANAQASAIAAAASAATASAQAVNVGQYFAEVDAARVAAGESASAAAGSAAVVSSEVAAAGTAASAAAGSASVATQQASDAAQSATAAAASAASITSAVSEATAAATTSSTKADLAAASANDAASAATTATAAAATASSAAADAAAAVASIPSGGSNPLPVTLSGVTNTDGTVTITANLAPGWIASGFQWMRDGAPIAGATSSTYTTVNADVGTEINVDPGVLTFIPTGISIGGVVSDIWDDSDIFADTQILED
jgi:hypothetical protein